jgi:hypothetical protein
MAQGFLPFQYETERGSSSATSHAGLMLYVELFQALGLRKAIEKEVGVRRETLGYSDWQVVLSLLLLNLAGGECVSDLDVLEGDQGFCKAYRAVENHGLQRRERRELGDRFPEGRARTLPSSSATFRYLAGFHTAVGGPEVKGAYIPPAPAPLQGLRRVNGQVLSRAQKHRRSRTATLDLDATLDETWKREAKYCYKHFKAYQPLNVYWWEQELVVHSEFRDGNVPAGFELRRVLAEALTYLPAGVDQVYLRSDSAGYDHELLGYCDDGKKERFGRIEFAVSCDVTPQFKAAVVQVPEEEWGPLYREEKGKKIATGREWAEVCFVPNRLCSKKRGREYRYLATREALSQPPLPGLAEQLDLPFPTMTMNATSYKIFGVVTNRDLPGAELILWHDQRSGRSEEAHAVMKNDLAGGTLPSGDFGENAAWWMIMILAFNLHTAMKRLALGPSWARSRIKALRFHLINLPGRVLRHAGRLIIRLPGDHPSFDLLLAARGRILALARAP